MKTSIDRITVDPDICFGKPCIRGMRWPVSILLGIMSGGNSYEDILEDHPELEKEDLLAALEYAKALSEGKLILARA